MVFSQLGHLKHDMVRMVGRVPGIDNEGDLTLITLPYKLFLWALALWIGGLSCSSMVGGNWEARLGLEVSRFNKTMHL